MPKFSSRLAEKDRKKAKKKRPLHLQNKKKSGKATKEYTPFPPQQQPSKIDLQLESGEYFLNEQQRLERRKAEKMARAAENSKLKKQRRLADFDAPAEPQGKGTGQYAWIVVEEEEEQERRWVEHDRCGAGDLDALRHRLMEKSKSKGGVARESFGVVVQEIEQCIVSC